MDNSSHLTEPGVRSFLCGILRTCRDKKNALYNKLFNITAFLLFIGILGGILYYRRQTKIPEEEKKSRRKKEEMYRKNKIYEKQNKKRSKSYYHRIAKIR